MDIMAWFSTRKRQTDERRNGDRLDKAFTVYLSGDAGISRGVARNISRSGMLVECAVEYGVGSTIDVAFVTPTGREELAAHAVVRRLNRVIYEGELHPRREVVRLGLEFVEFHERLAFTGRLAPQTL
jgi:hypothetical protein